MVGLRGKFARLRGRLGGAGADRRARGRRPTWEALEGRQMLSGLGTDYTLIGGRWDNATPISFSFAADGVSWNQGTNVANATLGAEFGGTAWHDAIARALQTWAASTNLDFVAAGDGSYAFNAPGRAEGDARFGDIRIGGYDFGDPSTIARTFGPPPNGQTGAGDVQLNTAFNFAPDSRYNLESVALHELGHSLGLGESPQPTSVMYTYYAGNRTSLSPHDVEGIQSLYGARSDDAFQSRGLATSGGNAVDLTPALNSLNQFELGGLSLTRIGDVEYFSVVAPAIDGSTLKVTAKASGVSLLSPRVTVIDPSNGATLASQGQATQYGDDVTVTIPGAQAGHRYLIAVTGATGDAFAVGSYALQLGFFGGSAIAPAPSTPIPANPSPTSATPAADPIPAPPTVVPDRFGSINSFATAAELGPLGQTIVNGLTITSATDLRVFTFEAARAGTVWVASLGTTTLVADVLGRPVASGSGLIAFNAPAAGARYFLIFLSPNRAPVVNFGFAVATIPAPVVSAQATPTVPTPITVAAASPTTTLPSLPVPKGPAATTPKRPAPRKGQGK